MIRAPSGLSAAALGTAMVTLLAGHAASCRGLPPGGSQQPEPQLEFSVVGATQTAARDTVSVARMTADTVVVVGAMAVPNPCYDIDADLTSEAGSLTLNLVARSEPRVCPQVLAAYGYEARITRLQSGSYALTVNHSYPSTGWDGGRYHLELTVPPHQP